MNNLFEMTNIYKQFDDKTLIKDFSMKVEQGKKLLLFGQSGTGKSTILKMMLGFVRPDRGVVSYRDMALCSSNVWTMRRELAYTPQDTDMGNECVGDIIKYTMQLHANTHHCCNNEQINEYLKQFNLAKDILKKQFNDISGGEKQRILLTIALALNRNIYLLDEPTASLDAGMKQFIVNMFSSMKDATVIVVSHDDVWINDRFERITI